VLTPGEAIPLCTFNRARANAAGFREKEDEQNAPLEKNLCRSGHAELRARRTNGKGRSAQTI